MTPIAPHMSAFLREHLPQQKGASAHTCESYADAFRLLFEFASQRFQVTPSALQLEQIDAPLIVEFLRHLETERHNRARTRNAQCPVSRDQVLYALCRVSGTGIAGTKPTDPRHSHQAYRNALGPLAVPGGDASHSQCP